ncbi:MAG TPA: aminomethyltransferase family protein [Candidatus Saccharimonadales bacterium]|nr:aminomethyltransferase family protein [Candidatus Saccharimonadales bacterium]
MSETVRAIPNRTRLFEAQQSLGASFAQFQEWEMADKYTDAVEEHLRVRSTVGLIDLSYLGVIKVGGKEGGQFLHGLVTNEIKGLEKGKGGRAAFLTGKGKVMALCRVLGLGDEYLIINDPQTHEKVFKYVFPFSYAGDFRVDDVSADYRTLSIQGPQALLVMKEISFEPVPALEEHGWTETIIAGQHVLVVRTSHTGEQGFDILVSEAGLQDVWDFILLKGAFHKIAPVGLRALDSLRIEAGIPVYGNDADDSNMMLELGLTDAVSFTKGCYTGQEAVAMATYRGHVSKRLSGLLIAGETMPDPGNKIIKDGKEVGQITSAIKSPSLGSVIALGYVKYGSFEPWTKLEVQHEEDSLPAEVVELPFIKRDAVR